MLILPSEPPDPRQAAHLVGHDRRPPMNAVAHRSPGEVLDFGVRDSFDQAEPEQRRGLPLGDNIGLGRDDLLHRGIDGVILQQRAAQLGERIEHAVFHASNRVTVIALAPPVARAEWQATHESLLKMGPSPLAIVSTFSNSVLPAPKAALCASVRLGSGSPLHRPSRNV